MMDLIYNCSFMAIAVGLVLTFGANIQKPAGRKVARIGGVLVLSGILVVFVRVLIENGTL